jgi:hypothetical protein
MAAAGVDRSAGMTGRRDFGSDEGRHLDDRLPPTERSPTGRRPHSNLRLRRLPCRYNSRSNSQNKWTTPWGQVNTTHGYRLALQVYMKLTLHVFEVTFTT